MKSVIRLFTELLSISGIIAAFGYMELRAHWTYLGVTALPGIAAERYLMEAYAVVGEMLLPVMAAAFVLLLAAWAGTLIRARLAQTRAEGVIRSAEKLLPRAILVVLVVGELLVLAAISGRITVAIGPLAAIAAEQKQGRIGFLVLLLVLILICGIALAVARSATSGLRKWGLTAVALTILLQTPTLYGRRIRNAVYASARVTLTQNPTPLSALILLQTDDAIELWIPREGSGRIVVIPAGQVTRVDLGHGLDLFDTARHLVEDRSAGAFDKKAGL